MKVTNGAVIVMEASKSADAFSVSIGIPNPPQRTGSENSSLSSGNSETLKSAG